MALPGGASGAIISLFAAACFGLSRTRHLEGEKPTVSDPYSFSDVTPPPAAWGGMAPTDAQRRLLLLQQLRLAANNTPGQAASAPAPQSVPNGDPSVVPVVQAPAPDGMLQALRVANATPSAAPDQSSPGQVPAQPAAGGGMLQALRDSLNTKIDKVLDTPTGFFDENGNVPGLLGRIANTDKVLASYVPGPAGDMAASAADAATSKQGMKDALHAGVNTALDPATSARVLNSVGRGVQQGLSGFNEGVGNVVFAPADLLDRGTDYVAGKLAAAFGATPPAVQRTHDYYNRAFVDPAGQPETKLEQRIRGTARSFGTDLPALLVGGGLASAGARSGVTLAEQEAPGLLEGVRAPLTKLKDYIGENGKVTKENVDAAMGFLAEKLKGMVPNYINALHPTNIVNAVRTPNLQGAADRALERVAAHPYLTTYGDVARDWRSEKKREAQAAAQQ
jgi:hypothetical protein